MATTPVTPPEGLPPVSAVKPPEDPELARLRGEVTKNRTELDNLRARFTAPPQSAVQPQGQMSSADMAREFYKDPIQASVAIATKVLQDQQKAGNDSSRSTLIEVARNSVRTRSPETAVLFDKYLPEIEAAVSTVDPQIQTNINVWDNAFTLVKGKHMDEIWAERQSQQSQSDANRSPAVHIKQGGGPEPSSARPAATAAGTELSPEEKRTARKLGLSEDQYKAGKKHYNEQNDPVTHPVGKSSWDDQITFSSVERRRKLRAAAKGAKS